eukprot:PITA_06746
MSNILNIAEPPNYKEVSKLKEWRTAMNEEMESILRNNTWDLVELPKNKTPIGCKWLFKPKMDVDGSIEKLRLVAKGYSQQKGIDFDDTFTLVAKLNTIRMLIALATKCNCKLHQLDVKSAFLNGDLKEEIYLAQPEGFVKKGQEHLVCRLKKALYDLKQALRSWYEKVDSFFLEHDFHRSLNDPNLYTKYNNQRQIILISLYVDDLIITGDADDLIREIKRLMAQFFEMKDLGSLHYCLGLEVCRDTVQTFLPKGSFSDSDWGGNLDDRKSITGYAFNIGSEIIAWSSKKQSTVALSSCEAEYQALCAMTCEAIWLRRLLKDAGKEQKNSTPIKSDNQSTIKLAHNPVFHKNTKHIDTQLHFIREKVQPKEIIVEYCKTCDSVIDIFTKPLA